MEFDPLLGTFTTQEQGKFTLDNITSESINLGETPEVPKLLNDDTTQNLGTLPSRMITMVTDRGVLDFEPVTDKNSDPKLCPKRTSWPPFCDNSSGIIAVITGFIKDNKRLSLTA